MNVLDLFAGAGGFSTGFEKAGFKVVQAIEIEKDMALTLKENHKDTEVIHDDIKNIKNISQSIDVVIGGPPCQGFSMAGARVREGFINDPRNFLFKEYIRILKMAKPKYFVMENVPGVLTMHDGKIFREIMNALESITIDGKKYKVSHRVLNSNDFGVPQLRRRMIIFGSLYGDDINQMKSPNIIKPNVWDAISDLANITPKRTITLNTGVTTNWHVQANHSQETISKIKKVRNNETIPISSHFSGAYKIMEKHLPAKTITTRFDAPSAGQYIHPTLNRTITPREAARIQTFPDDYIFVGKITSIRKMIGNAVPVNMAKCIADFIKQRSENELKK